MLLMLFMLLMMTMRPHTNMLKTKIRTDVTQDISSREKLNENVFLNNFVSNEKFHWVVKGIRSHLRNQYITCKDCLICQTYY